MLFGGRAASSRGVAATLILMGLGLVGLGAVPWFAVALVFAGAAGVGYLTSNVAATSGLQLGVDDAVRGRIMAIWSIVFLGIRPIASVIDGALASAFGVRVATVAMATPAFVLAAALLVRARRASGVTSMPFRVRT